MKQTINYTNYLTNFDTNKIPLEQQICLLKTSDNVKEKAMVKLKEVKAKSEDTGAKARQYLEGLLKIPFGTYKNEPILSIVDDSVKIFTDLVKNNKKIITDVNLFSMKEKYTSAEIFKHSIELDTSFKNIYSNYLLNKLSLFVDTTKRTTLINMICNINNIIKKEGLKIPKLCHSGKKSLYMKQHINDFIKLYQTSHPSIIYDLSIIFKIIEQCPVNTITKNTTAIIKK